MKPCEGKLGSLDNDLFTLLMNLIHFYKLQRKTYNRDLNWPYNPVHISNIIDILTKW